MSTLKPDELVLLISPDRKRFLVNLTPGESFHTHRGAVSLDDLIGADPGVRVASHMGEMFVALRPSMEEVLSNIRRSTQIVFPKDIGYLLLKLSIAPGVRVIEAGSGSGGLTMALARYIWPGGQVYTYEVRPEFHQLAWENVGRMGLSKAVTFHRADIAEGFAERDVDAVILDVREPGLYLRQAADALAPGGYFGCLIPTLNQVIRVLHHLERTPFVDVEVAELILRQYKTVPERLRPLDRLSAHTGFLITARHLPGAERSDDGTGEDQAPEDMQDEE